MKVLLKNDSGETPENDVWPKVLLCTGNGNGGGGCGSVLLLEEGDLFETVHRFSGYFIGLVQDGVMPGVIDTYLTCKCPECGIQTDLRHQNRELLWPEKKKRKKKK